MTAPRFFCETINKSGDVIISDVQLRHLTKVLRLKTGDTVELFDGKGIVAQAVIEKITKNNAQLQIKTIETLNQPVKQRITIASSVAKSHRFELVIAKCTELGIDRIVPIIFERTVKQADSKNAMRRFESIAIESAKQCGRTFLPVVDSPLNFEQALEKLQADYPNAKIIFGSLTEDAKSIINSDVAADDVIAFIGPEGGMTEAEENTLKKINALPVKLTDTILRIETAAITLAAILAVKRDSGK